MNIQQKAKDLLNQHSADYADANTNIHFAGALAAIEAALSQPIEPPGAVVGEDLRAVLKEMHERWLDVAKQYDFLGQTGMANGLYDASRELETALNQGKK